MTDCHTRDEETLDALGACFADEDSSGCIQQATAAGLHTISKDGTDRLVMEGGPDAPIPRGCVVKFARPWGHRQGANRHEVDNWETFDHSTRRYFVPVVDYDGDRYHWLTMPLADPNVDHDTAAAVEEKLYNEEGWECQDVRSNHRIRDVQPEEFARYEGEVRIVDYGAPCTQVNRVE